MSNIVKDLKETSAAATEVQALAVETPSVTTSAIETPSVQKRVVFRVMKETSGNHLF